MHCDFSELHKSCSASNADGPMATAEDKMPMLVELIGERADAVVNRPSGNDRKFFCTGVDLLCFYSSPLKSRKHAKINNRLRWLMKKLVHNALNAVGFEIRRTRATPTDVIGKDPWDDIASFLNSNRPIIIDVGANEGQTVLRCRSRFPNCVLHAFEPSPDTFSLLRENCGDLPDVHIWNSAIGATECQLTLLENSSSAMSSILKLGQYGWGKIVKETKIQVTTIDAFCRANGIDHVDILKSDTQGFDFEVLKGCEEMMRKGKISLVYFEVIFSEQYKGVASFGDVYEFLRSHEFRLVTFYELYYQARLASWTDVLFVHESLVQPNS